MLKIAIVSAALIVGSATTVFAQSMVHHHAWPTSGVSVHRHVILANGRCDGISYGTGARSCGTATGGPVGGLTSRN